MAELADPGMESRDMNPRFLRVQELGFTRNFPVTDKLDFLILAEFPWNGSGWMIRVVSVGHATILPHSDILKTGSPIERLR